MRVLLVLAVVASCSTPAAQGTSAPTVSNRTVAPVRELVVQLERHGCRSGKCARYDVAIATDGAVEWHGRENVSAIGLRRGVVSSSDLEQLVAKLDDARFFDRDETGNLPIEPASTKLNICIDRSLAKVTASRVGITHAMTFSMCSAEMELRELVILIDRLAKTEHWKKQP